MAEGLKIINEIYKRVVAKHDVLATASTYLSVNMSVVVLSDPANVDLWERLKAYCDKEEQHDNT